MNARGGRRDLGGELMDGLAGRDGEHRRHLVGSHERVERLQLGWLKTGLGQRRAVERRDPVRGEPAVDRVSPIGELEASAARPGVLVAQARNRPALGVGQLSAQNRLVAASRTSSS
jgi:hypothetical protein